MKKIGILTGGGDAPGLNAVIRAAVLTAIKVYDCEVYGIRNGYDGFLRKMELCHWGWRKYAEFCRARHNLGSANRGNPYARKVIRDGREVTIDVSEEIVKGIDKLKLEALLVLGGDGTLRIAHELWQKGVPIIGVPKTIDNDIGGTEAPLGLTLRSTLPQKHLTACILQPSRITAPWCLNSWGAMPALLLCKQVFPAGRM